MESAPGLEFLDELSATLDIELSEPAQPLGEGLWMQQAPQAAKLVAARLVDLEVLEGDDVRAVTDAELDQVVFREARITLRSETDEDVEHAAPNGSYFSVRDVLAAVEATELKTRGGTEWFGGIDVHHVFFEGLELEEEDPPIWRVVWGS